MIESIVRERHSAKRIVLYSHKGGVGKTTLTVNIAFALAALNKKVLLVDTDPQCNLSAYLLDSAFLDKLLDGSDSPEGATIWSIVAGVADLRESDPRPMTPMVRPFGLSLIPGDIKLSEFEEKLAYDWQLALRRDIAGFSSVTAISLAVNSICAHHDIDFVFYDCGPNIGPLNRCILMDSDHFAIPTACDEFSIRALSTLGATLVNWLEDWQAIAELAPDGTYLPPGNPKFLGYILERFKVYGGEIASSYAAFVPRIERGVQESVVAVLRAAHPSSIQPNFQARFGELRDLSGLMGTGQSVGRPIWDIPGTNKDLAAQARTSFFAMAHSLIALDERGSR
jgi:cellulose biosynthesis protein BcsQ